MLHTPFTTCLFVEKNKGNNEMGWFHSFAIKGIRLPILGAWAHLPLINTRAPIPGSSWGKRWGFSWWTKEKHLRVRCCAHILNLLVQYGMAIAHGEIDKIRDL
ncbi:hypothetical protein ACJX0J_037410, partial [Zea mays]